jgi:hypothetical protein
MHGLVEKKHPRIVMINLLECAGIVCVAGQF